MSTRTGTSMRTLQRARLIRAARRCSPRGSLFAARIRMPKAASGTAVGTGGTEGHHGGVKVHVGKYKGIELRDLNVEAVQGLAEKWLPTAKANAKPSADDKRLIAALEWWKAEQEKATDDVPY